MSLLIKNKSTINIINKMGPKIDPYGTPISIFSKSSNLSLPSFLFSFIKIGRKKGQRFIEIKNT